MKLKPLEFGRLHDAIENSIQELRRPREERVEMVRQYVGAHYANGTSKRTPTNFLELAVTIYSRLLAARTPRCMVSTESMSLRPFARDIEIILNQVPDEIELGETVRNAVVEAMFGMGVVKVGIAPQGKEVDGEPYAEPYVDLVEMDDYFCDMTAKSWREVQYEGNDYWMNKDDVKEIFGEKLDGDVYNATDTAGGIQVKNIGVSNPSAEPFQDRVLLRDVYLYRSGRIITYAVSTMKVLDDRPFDGPEGSPYVRLCYSKVPGNLLPLPPAALWVDLHELGNAVFRKLARQAVAKKTIAGFPGGNDDDVRRFQLAEDGDGIRYSGPKPEMLATAGVDQASFAFWLSGAKDNFSYFAGNLDSLGGLGATSKTVGQDQLLAEAANARVSAMADEVADFVKQIFKRIAWYVWTDPVRVRHYRKTVQGAPMLGLDKEWTPETRDGDFIDYNFDVDVYSMQDDSPNTRLQKFGNVFESFIVPMMGMFQEQGMVIDAPALLSYLARHANLPELSEMIRRVDQPPDEGKPVQAARHATPAVTTRRYEHISRPTAGTRSGRDNVLARIMMGGNVQPNEANMVGGNP